MGLFEMIAQIYGGQYQAPPPQQPSIWNIPAPTPQDNITDDLDKLIKEMRKRHVK